MSQLVAEHITKNYGRTRVVEDVSLAVKSAEIVGLLGPNGAGKTTTFYCLVGLTRLDQGHIFLDNEDITRAPLHRRARQGLGYLPQESSIFRSLSARKNILAIVELNKSIKRSARAKRVNDLLEEFRLQHVAETRGEHLSGGERRRLEIARALASDPKFLLFDEPFAGVDPISVNEIKDNIRNLSQRGLGVLLTDHNVRETLDLCDRAYIVNEGHIIASGTPEEVSLNERVREVYLGEEFEL